LSLLAFIEYSIITKPILGSKVFSSLEYNKSFSILDSGICYRRDGNKLTIWSRSTFVWVYHWWTCLVKRERNDLTLNQPTKA